MEIRRISVETFSFNLMNSKCKYARRESFIVLTEFIKFD